ncbi:MAG: flagellar export protein FliJ [Gammaproteobacteria bacterium]|nr:MAG: flagellar export protein FliJ [Gammaproteobacteria bacterium]RKZ95487.1 MAG: flagellar export protein FliJ [Gammaproteobacteria bacterium]RKZ98588.1 MAG: flagellar export protein FliJ [Gammaproteobacteria bacterium]RLA00509.1 MAG: flagellar export protein FliJ [Gammaproteobacteria bacterium]
MKRSKRLTPIVDLAVKATEAALIKVGEANALWIRDTNQLEELYRYQGEYLARLRSGDVLSMSAQKVLELRGFLAQLDQAILAQQQQVKISLEVLQQQQEQWKKVRSKEQAMQSLVSRYHHEEVRIEIKKEQDDNDERNTSQWLRKPK